jgi:nitrogenase iron protein NifH
MSPRVLAFYGKGGIGKSTVVSNLGVLFARGGHRVLVFGCDPKSDSCYSLVSGPVTTVMERWGEVGDTDLRFEDCLMHGAYGVDCVEVGGPTPGSGCGGRGITKALELVGDLEGLAARYDVVLFDVLGDVVCGGFSAPMRARFGDEVFVVTSGEFRSLFAANNICQAVRLHARSGARLGGFIANLKDLDGEAERVDQLAEAVGSRAMQRVPRDPAVATAELARQPVVVHDPGSRAAIALTELCQRIDARDPNDAVVPRPLMRADLDEMFLARCSASSPP